MVRSVGGCGVRENLRRRMAGAGGVTLRDISGGKKQLGASLLSGEAA